jgi:hypothetical protein
LSDLDPVLGRIGAEHAVHIHRIEHGGEVADDLGLGRLAVERNGKKDGVVADGPGAGGIGDDADGRGRVGAGDRRLVLGGEVLDEAQDAVAVRVGHPVVFPDEPQGTQPVTPAAPRAVRWRSKAGRSTSHAASNGVTRAGMTPCGFSTGIFFGLLHADNVPTGRIENNLCRHDFGTRIGSARG